MKSIQLRDHEVKRLASTGSVLIWRPVKSSVEPDWPLQSEPQGEDDNAWYFDGGVFSHVVHCPFGATGETRFVKETWRSWDEEQRILYKADYQPIEMKMRWKPAATMPKEVSRFRVTLNVSCRRIQSVTEEEAERSGSFLGRCKCSGMQSKPRNHIEALFTQHWCHIHGHEWRTLHAKDWDANSWFWSIECREVKPCQTT